tara:strand:+ start:918 stop:1244 length:327 start_codon:yes stop_codon:yes gene_type:complete
MFVWLLKLFARTWNIGRAVVFQRGLLVDQVSVARLLTENVSDDLDRPLFVKFHTDSFTSPQGGKRTLEVKKWDASIFRRYQIDITITGDYLDQLEASLRRLNDDRSWT